MALRIYLSIFLVLLSGFVVAEDNLESDLELLDFSGLSLDDEDETVLDVPQAQPETQAKTPQKKQQREGQRGCRCQCLTEGLAPKNKKTFRGSLINGSCVCACRSTSG